MVEQEAPVLLRSLTETLILQQCMIQKAFMKLPEIS